MNKYKNLIGGLAILLNITLTSTATQASNPNFQKTNNIKTTTTTTKPEFANGLGYILNENGEISEIIDNDTGIILNYDNKTIKLSNGLTLPYLEGKIPNLDYKRHQSLEECLKLGKQIKKLEQNEKENEKEIYKLKNNFYRTKLESKRYDVNFQNLSIKKEMLKSKLGSENYDEIIKVYQNARLSLEYYLLTTK